MIQKNVSRSLHTFNPLSLYLWGLNAIQSRNRKYALDKDFDIERIFDLDPWSRILVQGQCTFSSARQFLMKLIQTRLDKRQYAPEKILNKKNISTYAFHLEYCFWIAAHFLPTGTVLVKFKPDIVQREKSKICSGNTKSDVWKD